MRLSTRIRDCLYLNWAVPADLLPPAPPPLRYELHRDGDRSYALASALLFHQEGLSAELLPLPRLSFPQFNLRLYVHDDEGMPSVLFRLMLVPGWVVPSVRMVARQPAKWAHFEYRSSHGGAADTSWEWRVDAHDSFACRAEPGGEAPVGAHLFTSWHEAVDYVRLRNRGYFESQGRLTRIDTENHPIEAVPVRAEVTEASLVSSALGLSQCPPLHSAWLCPEMPLVFDLVRDGGLALPAEAPAPG